MMRTIVVPLDGSPFAETALAPAVKLAKSAGAELRLVMVHQPVMALVPAADIPIAPGPDDLEVRAYEQTYLADVADRLGRVGPHKVTADVIDGMAGPALVEFLAGQGPDLVVMSTHGRGPLSRFWLGSVADYLLRHAPVPFLLLRPRDGDPVPGADLPLRSVLVPLDLSEDSEAILPLVTRTARVTQSHVTLFHVVEPILGVSGSIPPYPITVPQDQLEHHRGDAQRRLDETADRLRGDGLAVATRVSVGFGVAEGILDAMEQGKFDVVALSTHGAGGVKRMLLGSVADKVIRGSTKPVLVYRPPGHGA